MRSFLESRQAKGVSAQTLFGYETTLARFQRWARANQIASLRGLTPERLREWLIYLQTQHRDERAKPGQGRPLAGESVLTYFVRIRTWLRWLYGEGKLRVDPTERVDRPRTEQRLVPSLRETDAQALMGLWTSRTTPYDEAK